MPFWPKIARWLRKRIRRRRRQRFFPRFLAPGDLAFDIGAHEGRRTELFLAAGARVVCAEPLPANFEVLQKRFGDRPEVVLLPRALGAAEGEAVLRYSPRATSTASLSPEWIEAVRTAPRLNAPAFHWNESLPVRVTTLDRLIAEHGAPAFCKIDVEGFETQVLAGLSQPLAALSFEYTPERMAPAADCIGRLVQLGDYRFNYTRGDALRLVSPRWLRADGMVRALPRLAAGNLHGDVYARLRGGRGGKCRE